MRKKNPQFKENNPQEQGQIKEEMSFLIPRSLFGAPAFYRAPRRANMLMRDLDRSLFNDPFFSSPFPSMLSAQESFVPRSDVTEDKEKYTIVSDVPGFQKDQITAEFEDDTTLVIRGTYENVQETPAETADAGAAPASVDASAEPGSSVAKAEGENQVSVAKETPRYHTSERSYGSFQRYFTFPEPVDHEAVKATLENGVLQVDVPKIKKEAERRKVEIN